MSTLENVLVPVYLMHRYQAEAAVKLIGGVDYAYAVRGDGQPTNQPLPTDTQRAALAAVAQTWQPAFLALPDRVIGSDPAGASRLRARSRDCSIRTRAWCSIRWRRRKAGSTRCSTSCSTRSVFPASSSKTHAARAR